MLHFERQPLQEGGWTISTDLLKEIQDAIERRENHEDIPSWEQLEDVLLALEELFDD